MIIAEFFRTGTGQVLVRYKNKFGNLRSEAHRIHICGSQNLYEVITMVDLSQETIQKLFFEQIKKLNQR